MATVSHPLLQSFTFAPPIHGASLFSAYPSASLHPKRHRLPFTHLLHQQISPLTPSAILTEPATLALPDPDPPSSAPQPTTTDAIDFFDWNSQWYPVTAVDNLDKRVPTPVTIMASDLVVWWDRNGESWQVYEDKCPHRLAPLSEGRINEKGELQCSYHGWCFGPDSGSCTHIPQAPLDGVPVWKSKRACASVYPSVEQQGLLWFWPDSRPEFRGIAARNPPPSIPVLDDPTFINNGMHERNFPYGYEELIENVMDPAHVPFAHHGIQGFRERAKPLDYKVDKVEKSGYTGVTGRGPSKFIAPCIFTMDSENNSPKNDGNTTTQKRLVLVLICIPIAPRQSKVILTFLKNFSNWADKLIPRWLNHANANLVLDSDLILLHAIERKLVEIGDVPWVKACYVPTTSDTFVIAFRRWLRVYAGGGPNWGAKHAGLSPPLPREQLMDRYSSHVKMCRHCMAASQFFKGVEVFLQVLSVVLAAVLGAAAIMPIPQLKSWSIPLVILAIVSSVGSRWVSHFEHKVFHFHDYNHGLVK